MDSVPMIAMKSGFHYDGRDLKAGDKFFATPNHATLLGIVGNAKQEGAAVKQKQKPKPKPKPKQGGKGRYNRRDMRAA